MSDAELEPWTDEKIREGFIYDGGEAEYHDPISGAQTQRKIAGDIFDAWLTEHDRQIAERAWDEGARWAAVECAAIDDERQAWIAPGDNPYRIKEENNDN